MGEFFKSAIEYFNSGSAPDPSNDFVGRTVEVTGLKLRIKKLIAEGKQV